MKKRIVPILALLLALTMSLSVPAFAAEEPVDDITLINNILNEGIAAVNANVGAYARLINTGRVERTWNVNVIIIDGTVTGLTVYEGVIPPLIDRLNAHSNELTRVVPAKDPDAAIELSGSQIESGDIVRFVLGLGLHAEDPDVGFGPSTPISALRGQSFDMLIYKKSDEVPYTWHVAFV